MSVVRQKVGRTILSVKNPAKRPVFADSELSETTEGALREIVSSTDRNDAYDKSLAPFGRLQAQKFFS
ncbi:MAG: hypothetical protein RL215_970, partial [Planctomycetota bacterium]